MHFKWISVALDQMQIGQYLFFARFATRMNLQIGYTTNIKNRTDYLQVETNYG